MFPGVHLPWSLCPGSPRLTAFINSFSSNYAPTVCLALMGTQQCPWKKPPVLMEP